MKHLPYVNVLILSLSCASDYELKGQLPDIDPGDITDCDFTPISTSKISRYDCNPVFPNNGTSVSSVGFHVTEVLGHPFYQMWYNTEAGMEYAVSSDGTDWKAHPSSPLFTLDSGTWDEDAVTGQVVVWDPIDNQYVMSYQGYRLGVASDPNDDQWGIGITTSSDGVNWNKHPNNPVIDFTDYAISEQDFWNYFCTQAVSNPSTCSLIGISYTNSPPSSNLQPCWPLSIGLTDRGNFRGYVAAKSTEDVLRSFDWASFESAIWAGEEASLETLYYPACHVYSMDALSIDNWLINENQPILSGESGSYDGGGIASAAVVEFEGTLYMFYIGFSEWEESTVNAGLISGVNTSLNIATSTDGGISWVKDPDNPFPVQLSNPGVLSAVGAQVVGSRIHLWITDAYDTTQAVGYFYYEPNLESNHP